MSCFLGTSDYLGQESLRKLPIAKLTSTGSNWLQENRSRDGDASWKFPLVDLCKRKRVDGTKRSMLLVKFMVTCMMRDGVRVCDHSAKVSVSG